MDSDSKADEQEVDNLFHSLHITMHIEFSSDVLVAHFSGSL